jgi:predicted Rossmann-fold nucleotide-binding protein
LVEGSKDLHSKIPSLMKLECEWVLSVEMTLRIKKHMIVIINPFKEKRKMKEMMPLISNHITIEEDDNDKFLIEEDIEEALPIFE